MAQSLNAIFSYKTRNVNKYLLPLQEEDLNLVSVNPSIMGQETAETEPSSANATYTMNPVPPLQEQEGLATMTQTVLFVDDPVSPGISSWLGAEVQVENKISRRCSYEEMVHEEFEVELQSPGSALASNLDANEIWYNAVTRVTQWAITLQEVADERKNLAAQNSSKCLCHKAAAIVQKLQNLTQFLVCEDHEAPKASQDDLILCVDDVQSALRAGVSIQVNYFHTFVIF